MKLINIGFGSYVSPDRLVAVLDPDSNPIKRVAAAAKEEGKLIDATYGRKTRSVLAADSGHVILCALTTESVSQRIAGKTEGADHEEE